MNLTVVVAAYSSEQLLPDLVKCPGPILASAASEYERILVNGGSCDKS
jgi:hypothetical protein